MDKVESPCARTVGDITARGILIKIALVGSYAVLLVSNHCVIIQKPLGEDSDNLGEIE